MEKVSKEFLMYQREKSGEGLVIEGNFYEWEFYGQTEEELKKSILGNQECADCARSYGPWTDCKC